MGHGEWGQGPRLKIHPNREEGRGNGREKNRFYALLASIGVSVLFWVSLFVILFLALTR